MEPNRCCFTGHRRIESSLLLPLTAHLDVTLTALIRMGCLHFYAGGALGFDTLAAERTLAMRATYPEIALHLLLPCRDQCRSWSSEECVRYEQILAQADSYRYVSEAYSAAAMTKRNHALIANADVCVAFLQKQASGTGQTVRAAKAAGLTIINLADRLTPAELSHITR
ncbi:MAG: DUF1273 family protein [Clostridia bacterium]|nr:DUF1273 family protein [Clostridia bacterium]